MFHSKLSALENAELVFARNVERTTAITRVRVDSPLLYVSSELLISVWGVALRVAAVHILRENLLISL